MIHFPPLEYFWPWAARSAISHSMRDVLHLCSVIGCLLLGLSYILSSLLPRRYDFVHRTTLFIGSVLVFIALQTKKQGDTLHYLMVSYMVVALISPHFILKALKTAGIIPTSSESAPRSIKK